MCIPLKTASNNILYKIDTGLKKCTDIKFSHVIDHVFRRLVVVENNTQNYMLFMTDAQHSNL